MEGYKDLELSKNTIINLIKLYSEHYKLKLIYRNVEYLKYKIDRYDNNSQRLNEIANEIIRKFMFGYYNSKDFDNTCNLTINYIKEKFNETGLGIINLTLEDISNDVYIVLPNKWKEKTSIKIINIIEEIILQRLAKILSTDEAIKRDSNCFYFVSTIEQHLNYYKNELENINVQQFLFLLSSLSDMAINYSKYNECKAALDIHIKEYFSLAIRRIKESPIEEISGSYINPEVENLFASYAQIELGDSYEAGKCRQ